jgi:hypothetical protein
MSTFSFGSAIGSGSVCDARGAVNEILTGPKGGSAREFHARCVKISRIVPSRKCPRAIFIGILREKPVGIGVANKFLELVLTARAIDLRDSTNRHLTNKNQKTLLNV